MSVQSISTSPNTPPVHQESMPLDRYLASFLWRTWHFSRTLTLAILISVVMIPVVLLAMWLDPVIITGVNGWIKPFKFLVSTAIYMTTLLWFLMQVQGWRRFVQFTAWFVGVALLVEHSIIITQVIRRTSSHFNIGTPLDAALFSTMGMLIFIVAFLNLVVAVRLVFQPMDNRVSAWGIRLALLITVAGMLIATLMTVPTADQLAQLEKSGEMPYAGAHAVGAAEDGPGLPLVGWSTTGGDLRIAHFVGLHAMQVIPLIGWWLTRRRVAQALSENRRLILMGLAALGYGGLMGLLTWQALRGQSIVAPDGLTLAALSGLLVAIGLPAGWIIFNRKNI